MSAWCSCFSLLIAITCEIVPSHSSLAWTLGDNGESCTDACSKIGQQCTSRMLHQHNSEVNSERELAALIGSLNGNCTSYNLNYGSNTDVPAYQATTGACYVSDISRDENSFNCNRLPPIDKQRLCWCHNLMTEDGAQDQNASSNDLSSGVIIWIVSGNMLFLGGAFMCCGVVRRLMKKTQGKEEGTSLSQRPADPGIFVRCPACGCPLERSCSPSTYVAYARAAQHGDGTASKKTVRSVALVQGDEESERSGQTVKFRDEVSEVSASVNVNSIV